jgi:hypothetical protein
MINYELLRAPVFQPVKSLEKTGEINEKNFYVEVSGSKDEEMTITA